MFDYEKHVKSFGASGFISDERGYIVWRKGTGDNVELLHIKSLKPGGGTSLLRDMLEAVETYHSVFGFCLRSNQRALDFYAANGFKLHYLGQSVYRDDATVLFVAPYAKLKVSIEKRLTRLE